MNGLHQGKSERNRLAHEEYIGFTWPNIRYSSGGVVHVAFVYGVNHDALRLMRTLCGSSKCDTIEEVFSLFSSSS